MASRSYYTTAVADQPADCQGRGASDPVHASLHAYDDLGRSTLVSERRRDAAGDIYRTTARSWPGGGLLAQAVYPDSDQAEPFSTGSAAALTLWPDLLRRNARACAGGDCSGVKYFDIVDFDWLGAALTIAIGNGMSEARDYDLRGALLSRSVSLDGSLLFAETLRDMQFADGENPCPGSSSAPGYSEGLTIARALSGSGLPAADQDVWECYAYDGAGRLSQASRYRMGSADWDQLSSLAYGYDDNGNLLSMASAASDAWSLIRTLLPAATLSTSFTRNGSDQIATAAMASGATLTLAYDGTYGFLNQIATAADAGYSLAIASDPVLGLPLTQTVTAQDDDDAVLLTAAIDYDDAGLRASRTVVSGADPQATTTTRYWYGGGLHPLVIDRDGTSYRLLGDTAVEEIAGTQLAARSFLHSDHVGSVRMVTDATGNVMASLSYDDWGKTTISGASSSVDHLDVVSFYRFQAQEQETFPLTALGIDDPALASWLDDIALYNFPWRTYAAGFAAFLQQDPIPLEDSLYRPFRADPVNYVDDTGGPWSRQLRTKVNRARLILNGASAGRPVELQLEELEGVLRSLEETRNLRSSQVELNVLSYQDRVRRVNSMQAFFAHLPPTTSPDYHMEIPPEFFERGVPHANPFKTTYAKYLRYVIGERAYLNRRALYVSQEVAIQTQLSALITNLHRKRGELRDVWESQKERVFMFKLFNLALPIEEILQDILQEPAAQPPLPIQAMPPQPSVEPSDFGGDMMSEQGTSEYQFSVYSGTAGPANIASQPLEEEEEFAPTRMPPIAEHPAPAHSSAHEEHDDEKKGPDF